MALNTQMANAGVNAEADALARQLDTGWCRLYDGTQPATGDTALTGNILAELRFGVTSAPAAVAGVLTFNALTGDTAANATGTATHFRTFKSDGTTPVMDGSVGTSGCNLNLNTAAIVANAQVDITGFTHTVTKLWLMESYR